MKLFRRLFLLTTFLIGSLFVFTQYQGAKDYYSQFTSWENFNQIVENNEVIPDGTMLMGATGDTLVFLTATTTSSWTVPNNFNPTNNSVELIGGGAGGYSANASNQSDSGGGGAYAKKNNLNLTPGSSVQYSAGDRKSVV